MGGKTKAQKAHAPCRMDVKRAWRKNGLGEKKEEFEYRVPDQHLDSWELKPVNMESAAGDPDFKNRFLPCKRYSIKKKTVCSLWRTVRVGARSGGIGSMVPPAV